MKQKLIFDDKQLELLSSKDANKDLMEHLNFNNILKFWNYPNSFNVFIGLSRHFIRVTPDAADDLIRRWTMLLPESNWRLGLSVCVEGMTKGMHRVRNHMPSLSRISTRILKRSKACEPGVIQVGSWEARITSPEILRPRMLPIL